MGFPLAHFRGKRAHFILGDVGGIRYDQVKPRGTDRGKPTALMKRDTSLHTKMRGVAACDSQRLRGQVHPLPL